MDIKQSTIVAGDSFFEIAVNTNTKTKKKSREETILMSIVLLFGWTAYECQTIDWIFVQLNRR